MLTPEKIPVKLLGQDVRLAFDAAGRRSVGNVGHPQEGGEVEVLRLPVPLERTRQQHVGPANDFIQSSESHDAQEFADFLGDEEEVLDHLFGRAAELCAEDRVLRCDTHRASVEVALPHHDAAHGDQGGRRKAVLLGAQACRDDDVAPSFELTISLQAHPSSQPIADQGLLRLREAKLPGDSGMADARQRGCAGAAAVAADEDAVGIPLGDAGGDGADAGGRDQLHRDLGMRVRVLQVEDELGEVLDAVDVVVRRGGDQADARRAVAGLGDEVVDLVAGELPTLAGLGPLRHLDLDLDGVGEIVRGDAEPAAGDLLDGAVAKVAIGVALEPRGVFAPLAGVAPAADPVQGDGERLVRLLADAAEAHRAGEEPLDDLLGRLDQLQGDRLASLADLEQPAQGAEGAFLVVGREGELLVAGELLVLDGVLELLDGLGVPHVVFAPAPPHLLAAAVELRIFSTRDRRERELVAHQRLSGDHLDADPVETAGRAAEMRSISEPARARSPRRSAPRDSSTGC